MAQGETERRCESCGELNPARAKFCLECGTPFALTETTGERRVVSVLFADLSGFTAYSEGSDVEDVRAIAQTTASQLGDIVTRYGGFIDKIIGDCVMAVWGAPVAHEDDAERAVRAALDMQACVKENQERFASMALCVGIQSGEAMWSQVGSDGRYTVLGDTVNTAARLQGAAAKGEVLIGAPTWQAVQNVIDCEPIEPIKAKNKAEPVPAWRATTVKGQRSSHKPLVSALVGRTDELARLQEIFDRAVSERRPHTVTLLGSPGVGKSRLVDAFASSIGDSALVLRGRCLPYGEGITYWPVIEIIHQAADIRHDDDRETVSRKLGSLLESLGSEDLDELRTMAVALANLIGSPTTPRGTYSAEKISKGELHWGLRRIVELGAKILPTVLIFEDLHWAEPTLIELLDYLFDAKAGVPVVGICNGRPELQEVAPTLVGSRTNRRVLELDALDASAGAEIVRTLVGRDDIPGETIAALLNAAGGNPLFLEEIALMWRESGDDVAVDQLTIPSGLQALIDSRLDRLTSRERAILTHAAVVGNEFWGGTIASLEGVRADELAEVLDSLDRRDLIRSQPSSSISGEQEFAFKHGLIRDAAYARLTKKERVQLHQRCGHWISGLPGGDEEFAEIIAYHFEQACRMAADLSLSDAAAPMLPAARALTRAGTRAEARDGIREAERFLARAIELLGNRYPETAAESTLRHARLLLGLGRYEEAKTEFQLIAEGAKKLGRLDIRAQSLISLAETLVPLGATAEATPCVTEAETLARELADPAIRIRAMWIKAMMVELTDGPSAAVVETLQSAVALGEEVDDRGLALTARMRLGATYFNKGELELAEVHFTRSIELARQQGTLRAEAWCSACLGLIRFHRGPRSEADQLFAQAIEWLDRLGDVYMQAQTLMWRADAAIASNDLDPALAFLRRADELASKIGGAPAVRVARFLAEVLAWQHRSQDVRELVTIAETHAEAEDTLAQADLLVIRGFAAFAAGDESAMRRAFGQAIPILDRRDSPTDLGGGRLSFARVLEAIGDVTAAGDQLDRAREAFDQLGATATVEQIERDVARLRDVEIGTSNEPASG